MGLCYDSYGPNQISVEQRSESFYIHPGYGYDEKGIDHDDTITLEGKRVESPMARHWREGIHPEFLLEDVPHLLRALADLPTCPLEVKYAIEEAKV